MSAINYSDFRKPEHSLKPATWDQTFVFDIETKGDTQKTVEFGKPYPPFEEPKYGNTKDPEKRKALRDMKYEEWVEGEADWWNKQHDRSALSAITGRVVAIGYLFPYAHHGEGELWDTMHIEGLTDNGNHDIEESKLLKDFWTRFGNATTSYGHVIGHNIEGFDLPFLIQRSWQLDVAVHPTAFNGRYFHSNVVDTMKVWRLSDYKQLISLNDLSKILGVGKKMENYKATQFAEDYLHGDKDTAEYYLKTDLDLAFKCYQKMYRLSD
jgi:hypothetical protein